MLRAVLVACSFVLAGPAVAQDRQQTLADIRQQLSVLWYDVQNLRTELSTTGGPQVGQGGGSVLDRVAAAEAELQRLTAKTEELENRLNRIVSDGTNRIGDLAFRLCELEEGCNIASLDREEPLGGPLPDGQPLPATTPQTDGDGSLAVGEQADFDQAKAAFDSGDYVSAANLFQTFTNTYTAGPLYSEAHFWRGEALAQQGDTASAARAFLDSFSGAPSGNVAPQALLRLGQSLGDLGQVQEACVTLAEVNVRFMDNPAAAEAEASRRNLGCQ